MVWSVGFFLDNVIGVFVWGEHEDSDVPQKAGDSVQTTATGGAHTPGKVRRGARKEVPEGVTSDSR